VKITIIGQQGTSERILAEAKLQHGLRLSP
jgi:hypothetical protein